MVGALSIQGLSRTCTIVALPASFGLAPFAVPALAQEPAEASPAAEELPVLEPDEGRLILDSPEQPERDPVLAERCEDEADVARIAGEIIVCRDLGKATDGAWNKADWERRYAAETQGIKPVQVDGSGLQFPAEGSLATITFTVRGVCAVPPCAPEPALLIDVAALPEAPPGSDADRIARGLPPLGKDPNEDEIRRRREDLGLPPPRFTDEDE